MSLLTVVRDVCAVVGVTAPTSVFSGINTNRTMFEMLANANEMAQRIAYDTRDWTALMSTCVLEGDGIAEVFLLPAQFLRMTLTAKVRSYSHPTQPFLFVADIDEWNERRLNNTEASPGEWMFFAGKMYIRPIQPVGAQIIFPYIDKNCINLTSGGYGDRFMADTDVFRLDERLLKLGMIWNWKKDKGSPYAENMGEYSDAIANAMGHDKPAPIIIDRHPISAYARVAYPWPSSWGPQ